MSETNQRKNGATNMSDIAKSYKSIALLVCLSLVAPLV